MSQCVASRTHYNVTSVATVANGHCVHSMDQRYALRGVNNVTICIVYMSVTSLLHFYKYRFDSVCCHEKEISGL